MRIKAKKPSSREIVPKEVRTQVDYDVEALMCVLAATQAGVRPADGEPLGLQRADDLLIRLVRKLAEASSVG